MGAKGRYAGGKMGGFRHCGHAGRLYFADSANETII